MSWEEGLFIFRELGSTGDYFRGTGKQAQFLGGGWGKGALPKSKKSRIRFFEMSLACRPSDPPLHLHILYLRLPLVANFSNCAVKIMHGKYFLFRGRPFDNLDGKPVFFSSKNNNVRGGIKKFVH